METPTQVKKIVKKVQQLDEAEHQALLSKIQKLLESAEIKKKPPFQLHKLAGVGAELWKDVDVEDYIRKEREWD